LFAKKGNSNLITFLVLGSSHRADFNLDLGTITFSSGNNSFRNCNFMEFFPAFKP
jgi:hypothetical protein